MDWRAVLGKSTTSFVPNPSTAIVWVQVVVRSQNGNSCQAFTALRSNDPFTAIIQALGRPFPPNPETDPRRKGYAGLRDKGPRGLHRLAKLKDRSLFRYTQHALYATASHRQPHSSLIFPTA